MLFAITQHLINQRHPACEPHFLFKPRTDSTDVIRGTKTVMNRACLFSQCIVGVFFYYYYFSFFLQTEIILKDNRHSFNQCFFSDVKNLRYKIQVKKLIYIQLPEFLQQTILIVSTSKSYIYIYINVPQIPIYKFVKLKIQQNVCFFR